MTPTLYSRALSLALWTVALFTLAAVCYWLGPNPQSLAFVAAGVVGAWLLVRRARWAA